jgi:hypothetical protein
MSGSYPIDRNEWLRGLLQDEGKLPKPKERKPQPHKRMRIDQMAEWELETKRLLALRSEPQKATSERETSDDDSEIPSN